MSNKGYTKGPCGGAGPNANKGLSQHKNGRSNDRLERFSIMVYGQINREVSLLRGKEGTVHVGHGKTVLGTFLARQDDELGTIIATVKNPDVKKVNFFMIRASERTGEQFGRVLCTASGRPLPRRKCTNTRFIGEERLDKKQQPYIVQPTFSSLTHVYVVDVVGSRDRIRVTRFGFDAENRGPTSIALTDESCHMDLPDNLGAYFYLSGDIPSQEEVEETLRDHMDVIMDQDDKDSWTPMIPAIATAFLKALGKEDAFYLELEEVQEEAAPDKPETNEAPDAEEPAEQILAGTGTDGPVSDAVAAVVEANIKAEAGDTAKQKTPRKKKAASK